jgi:hypothetical protein
MRQDSHTAIISAWAGWTPGVFTEQEWRQFFNGGPVDPDRQDPPVPELPSLMKRRMGRISRMCAATAFACCHKRGVSPRDVPLVFASRHGELTALMGLLSQMAEGEPVSPTGFSHSVHHTAGSYFSIASGNSHELRSVAGREATFAYGFLDALGLLHERGKTDVLLITADEEVPPLFENLVREDRRPYVTGLLLSRNVDQPGIPVHFGVHPSVPSLEKKTSRYSQSLAFLNWLTGPHAVFESLLGGNKWVWSK